MQPNRHGQNQAILDAPVDHLRAGAPFDAARCRVSVFEALLRIRALKGGGAVALEDHDRKPLTYDGLVRAAFALGGRIKPLTARGERVGVLLPTGVGCTVTFFALHAIGRIPAMLNFTSGALNLRAACAGAGVTRILTARKFVEQGKLEDLVAALGETIEITYLEDIKDKLGLGDKLGALAKASFARRAAARAHPDDVAVILFTSGSFGTPRGALLSHANLVGNVEQAAAHIAFDPEWVFFNPLPMFHCFGLTAGTLLPLLTGLKTFLYPSPLHFKEIPKLIKECGANVLIATDTFAGQYARGSNEGELSSLRFAVLGAERIRPETRRTYQNKFNVELLEGYGATEASPVIAVNQPGANRHGTVGRLLPGIEARLEVVPGIAEGRKLLVRGPNIMKGYLNPAAPAGFDPLPDGWHDTGDVVDIDGDGYVAIKGRVKRFAKIGGEMVSLAAVETYAAAVWPGSNHAAVSVPCPRKGERVVLVTDRPNAELSAFIAWAQESGAPEISFPKKIVHLAQIPVLGTGKTDYVTVQKVAEEQARAAADAA